MSKFNFLFLIVLSSILLISCTKPSLEDDAQKAAELTNLSNQRILENDFGGAEKYYKDAQEIIDKHRNTDKFRDFFTLYNGFLEAGVYKQMEGYINDEEKSQEDGF